MTLYTRRIRENVRKEIRRRRVACGFASVEQLAVAIATEFGIHLDAKQIHEIEGGTRLCPIDILVILANFYGQSMNDFIETPEPYGATKDAAINFEKAAQHYTREAQLSELSKFLAETD